MGAGLDAARSVPDGCRSRDGCSTHPPRCEGSSPQLGGAGKAPVPPCRMRTMGAVEAAGPALLCHRAGS